MKITNLRQSCALSALVTGLVLPLSAAAQEEDDTIVVTASPLGQALDDTLVGVSVLSGEDLANRQTSSSNIGEILKAEPGVSSTFFGAGASRPIIRGQGEGRIRVLTNGIGEIDASATSPDHAVAVEPALAERIEVIRGSGVLRYGSSGSGGVVNVLDGRIPQDAPENGYEGAVRLSATTVDDGFEAAAGANFLAGQVGDADVVLHLEGTFRETEDYDIPGFARSDFARANEPLEDGEEEVSGTLENSFTESESGAIGLSFITDRGFFGFSLKQLETLYGVPTEEEEEEEEGGEEEEEEGGIAIDLEQTRFDINGRYEFADGPFEAANLFFGIADYEHTELEGDEVGTVFTNEGYEGRVELIGRLQNGWQGAYGLQFREREFSAVGAEAFVPPTDTTQLGLYTFHEVDNGDWHFEGSARYENTSHESTTTGTDLEFDTFSISAGADYHISEMVRLGGTIFRTERAPSTEELFSNGPHLATAQFEVGDPTLDEEVATGVEAVLRVRGEGASVTFNAFHTSYEDYIYGVETGEIEDGLDVFQFMAEDAVFRGFEIEGEKELGNAGGLDWSADLIVEYVEAELDVVNNDNLPRIPPLGVLAGIEASNDRYSFRGEVDFTDEQDSVSRNESPTGDYTFLNLFASVKPFPDNDNLTLRFAALNLTDEEGRQHTSFLKDTVPLPGQNFRFSLEAKF